VRKLRSEIHDDLGTELPRDDVIIIDQESSLGMHNDVRSQGVSAFDFSSTIAYARTSGVGRRR
jgi:hypothetical protein